MNLHFSHLNELKWFVWIKNVISWEVLYNLYYLLVVSLYVFQVFFFLFSDVHLQSLGIILDYIHLRYLFETYKHQIYCSLSAPSVSLDFLDMLGSNNNAGSQSTLNQTGSVSSVSSVGGQVTGQHGRLNRKYYSNKTTKANSLNPSQTADMAAIQAVEKAQNEPATARVQTGIRKSSRGLPVPKAGKVAEPNNEVDGLTTIAEYEENEQRELMKDAKESKASFLLPQRTPSQEVRPVHFICLIYFSHRFISAVRNRLRQSKNFVTRLQVRAWFVHSLRPSGMYDSQPSSTITMECMTFSYR